jgi:hypothetical protein
MTQTNIFYITYFYLFVNYLGYQFKKSKFKLMARKTQPKRLCGQQLSQLGTRF